MSHTMKALVIFRIADQRLRKELHGKLKNRGISPVGGIFECGFSPGEFERLSEYLRRLPYGENDCAIVYPLCAACRKNRLSFGSERGLAEGADWIII